MYDTDFTADGEIAGLTLALDLTLLGLDDGAVGNAAAEYRTSWDKPVCETDFTSCTEPTADSEMDLKRGVSTCSPSSPPFTKHSNTVSE